MVLKVTGKIHPNGNGLLIYIPIVMAQDSNFTFRAEDQIELSVMGSRLEITKVPRGEGEPDGE